MTSQKEILETVMKSAKALEASLSTFGDDINKAVHQIVDSNPTSHENEFIYVNFPEIQEYQEFEDYDEHVIPSVITNPNLGVLDGGAFIEKSWYLSHSK